MERGRERGWGGKREREEERERGKSEREREGERETETTKAEIGKIWLNKYNWKENVLTTKTISLKTFWRKFTLFSADQ